MKGKVIMIAGHCGVGKTVAVEYFMQNLPNAVLLDCDAIMWDSIIKNPSVYEKVFGLPVTQDHGLKYMIDFISTGKMTVKIHKNFVDTAVPFVEAGVRAEIERLKSKGNADYIIAEWTCSPSYKKLWDAADVRVFIKAKTRELLTSVVIARTIRQGATPEAAAGEANMRFESMTHLIDIAKNIDFELVNSYDEVFFQDLKKCAIAIKSRFDIS